MTATVAPMLDVLLVEDDPNDAEFTVRGLRRHGFRGVVHHVQTAREALDFLGDGVTDAASLVVLLDLRLPDFDGLHILDAVRAATRTKIVPVVVFSSSGEPSDIIASYERGANSFVQKPVSFEAFDATIAALAGYWGEVNEPPRRRRGNGDVSG